MRSEQDNQIKIRSGQYSHIDKFQKLPNKPVRCPNNIISAPSQGNTPQQGREDVPQNKCQKPTVAMPKMKTCKNPSTTNKNIYIYIYIRLFFSRRIYIRTPYCRRYKIALAVLHMKKHFHLNHFHLAH